MGLFDFFKPQWKNRDPAIRAHAIRHLHDERQDLFLDIALGDSDAANRLAAARRIKDLPSLRQVRDKSQDKNLRELAQRSLVEILTRETLAATDDAAGLTKAKTAMDEISEEAHLIENLATQAKSLGIRRLATQKLSHPGGLLSVAQNETDEGLALEAFSRISREGHFETLAKQAKSKEVRRLAKEKLKQIEKSKQPDEAAINRQKMALILGVAEKAALAVSEASAHFPWDSVREQVLDAEQTLRQLMEQGNMPEPAQVTRFRDQLAVFHGHYETQRQEKQKRLDRERRETEAKAAKEAACLEMETLAASGREEGSASAELKERFEKAGSAGQDDDGLYRRFRQAFDKYERERFAKARERDEAERRRQTEIEGRERMLQLAQAAEALKAQLADENAATSSLPVVSEKIRDLRRDWQKAAASEIEFDGRRECATTFENALAGLEEWLKSQREKNLESMRKLVPEMEALGESNDFAMAEKRFRELNQAWRALQPAPQGQEADQLQTSFRIAADRFREAQDWLRWSNLRSKQDICAKLESLGEGEDRKAMFAKFKEMQDMWKTTGPVPWDASEALWERYHTVCDALFEKLKEYFAELDEERESHFKAKEEICARLEALLANDDWDWREASEAVKEAQSNWKTIGAVPKDKNEALWQRFKAITSRFFERKDAWMGDNVTKKSELVVLAESLQDSTDWKATTAAIKEAQEKWKQIGPVPKADNEALWGRFHAACEKFFTARRTHFEALETERPLNLARKQELCVQAEAIEALPTDQERYQRIVEIQAAWKEVGPAPREQEDALWERFRKPIDAYFQGRKARMEDESKRRDENAKLKEDICQEAESVTNSTDWKNTIETIKALQARWRTIGPAPRDKDKDLWNRFRTACDGFFDRLKQNAQKRDAEREGNLRKKEDLCFMVEAMSGAPVTEEEQKKRAAWQLEKMAESGKPGSATASAPTEGGQRDWRAATEKIKNLQKEWKKIGPVPKEKSEELWDRFHRACDHFFEERRRALGLPEEDPQVNLDQKLALIEEADKLAADPGEHQVQVVIQLRRQWKRIGPVPRAQSDYVWKRFNTACETAAGGALTDENGFRDSAAVAHSER
jgi:Domain of Unknown Function (DUF349)